MYFSPYIWATRCVVLLLVLRLRRCALRGILEWDMECEYAEAIMIGFRRKIGSNKHDYYSLKQQSSLFCVSEVSLSSVPSFVPSSRVFFRFFFSVFVSLHSLASLSLLSNDLYFFFSFSLLLEHFYGRNNSQQQIGWWAKGMLFRLAFIIAIILKWNVHHAIFDPI